MAICSWTEVLIKVGRENINQVQEVSEKDKNRFKKALEDQDEESSISLWRGPQMNWQKVKAEDQWFSNNKLSVD